MKIQFNKRDPVYLQVIQHFKEQIANGKFKPGEEIPSRRELANQLKINPNTAQRAYKEMEEEELIFTEGNLPSRITKDEKVIEKVRKELIISAVQTFIQSIQTINVPLEDAVELVKEYYDKEEEGSTND